MRENLLIIVIFLSYFMANGQEQSKTLAFHSYGNSFYPGDNGDSNLIKKPSSLNVLNEINLLKKDSIKKLNHFAISLGFEILTFNTYNVRDEFINGKWPLKEEELAKRFISFPEENDLHNFKNEPFSLRHIYWINYTYSVSYNVKNKFIYSLGGSYSNILSDNRLNGGYGYHSADIKVNRTNIYLESDYVLSEKNNFKRKLYFGLRLAGTFNTYNYSIHRYRRFPFDLPHYPTDPNSWREKKIMISAEASYYSLQPALGFTSFKRRFFIDFGVHFNTFTYVNGSYSYYFYRHINIDIYTEENNNNNKLNMFFINNNLVYDVYFKVGFRFKSKNIYLQKKKKD